MVSAIVLLLIFLPIIATLLLSLDPIQNRIIQYASTLATEKLESRVSIGHVNVDLLSRVHFKEFYVEDSACDTLLYVEEAVANISSLDIKREGLLFSEVELRGVDFNVRELESGKQNVSEIVERLRKPDAERRVDFKLFVDHVHLKDGRFTYERLVHRNPEYGVDYYDMDMRHIECCLKNFEVAKSVVSADIEELSLVERSGFKLDDLTGKFVVDGGVISFDNLRARTQHSQILLPTFVIDGDNWEEYKEFIDNVDMRGSIVSSTLSSCDLGYFSPGARNWGFDIRLHSGSFDGVVRDFKAVVNDMTLANATTLSADVHIVGDPGFKDLEWSASEYIVGVRSLYTTASDVEFLAKQFTGKPLGDKAVEIIRRLERASVRGTFGGKLDSFRTVGNVNTPMGNISADVAMQRTDISRFAIDGSVEADNVQLGQVLGVEGVGALSSLITVANGSVGEGGASADVSVKIQSVGLSEWQFEDIEANAAITPKLFNVRRVASKDEKLNFEVSNARVDLRGDLPEYDVDMAIIRCIDLHQLGINKRDSVSKAAFMLILDGKGSTLDNFNAQIRVSDISYEYPGGILESKELTIDPHHNKNLKTVRINSEFADVDFKCNSSYKKFGHYVADVLRQYIPLLFEGEAPEVDDAEHDGESSDIEYSTFNLTTKERIDELLDAIVKDVSVAPETTLDLTLDPAGKDLNLQLRSEVLSYKKWLLASPTIDLSNSNDTLQMWVRSEAIYDDLARRLMPNLFIYSSVKDNAISLIADFKDSENKQSGLLALDALVDRDMATRRRKIHVDISPSYFTTDTLQWQLSADGVDVDSMRVRVRNLHVVQPNPNNELKIDGVVSADPSDMLRIDFNNFDLSPLSAILKRWDYSLVARSNGHATIRSARRTPKISADIEIDSIRINDIDVPAQRLNVVSDFEKDQVRMIIADAESENRNIVCNYTPKDRHIYATTNMSGVEMRILQPVLMSVASDIEGTANVDVTLRGRIKRRGESGGDGDDRLTLSGRADIEGVGLMIDYLNTRYSAPSGEIKIDSNRIMANGVELFDENGNKGLFSLTVDLNNLFNIAYNVGIDAKDMLMLNTSSADNDLFYGKVYASGRVDVVGDKGGTKLNIEATCSEKQESKFYMPLDGKEDLSYAGFVQFTKPVTELDDTTKLYLADQLREREMRRQEISESSGVMDIAMNLTINPKLEVQLVIDPTVGDIIKARGDGKLNLDINTAESGAFTMGGDYIISEGTYLFTFQNVVNKLLTVEKGSKISWSGEPLNPTFDIRAVYKTKASLKPLIGSSVQGVDVGRAVPVEGYIIITDKMQEPEVNFDIKVPNASPEINEILRSALRDEQSVETQMMMLLLANSFIASESAGAIGASISTATGFELLSNQLSKWLSMEDSGVVFRYRPRTQLTGDEFDFGYSVNLLDHRLMLEAEGGYVSDAASQATQNARKFIYEVLVTWLLNEDGTLSLNFFTQPIDRYGENQGLQEWGVGVSIGESFNTWGDLREKIGEMFASTKRRQKREQRRAEKRDSTASAREDILQHSDAALEE